MTTFAPPPGFEGYESRTFDGFNSYTRACTPEETELLEANAAATEAGLRAEDAELLAHAEAERDAWFQMLSEELSAGRHPGLIRDPPSLQRQRRQAKVRDDRRARWKRSAF
jgi:hypothetical protein